MKFIIGKKLDMTQVWHGENVVGVTRVQTGPCVVVQVKTKDKDGYEAVQFGFGARKEKNIAKPQRNHMKKAGGNFKYLREMRISSVAPNDAKERQLQIGDVVNVETFAAGDGVQVSSVSKGKGFQGVVKRHGFHGQDKTHGNKDQLRMSGSIGAGGVAHVFKGTRMGGRTGGENVTTKNLEIAEVDKENNILYVKGAVPGARNGLVLIQGEGELKMAQINTDSKQINTESALVEATEMPADASETIDDRKQTIEKYVN